MGLNSQELTEEIAQMVDDKLATDIVALDMRELVSYTDYLIICTARNERQAAAISDAVHIKLKHARKMLPVNPDRSGDVGWSVLDYLDCVLHVFTAEARELFDLEELWHEAPRLELTLNAPEPQSTTAA